MGYESRTFIMNVHESSPLMGKKWAEWIAIIELSCMGYSNGWMKTFTKPVDYAIYMPDADEEIQEDCYGDKLMAASIDDVITCLERIEADRHYRRIPPLLAMLKSFDRSEWDELQVVHYGY